MVNAYVKMAIMMIIIILFVNNALYFGYNILLFINIIINNFISILCSYNVNENLVICS